MSRMSDLDYEIEQYYIEGHNPKTIAALLECPIELVLKWIENINCEWESSFPQEELSPFETINS